jgi:beta-N-acetylhexosaminidase
MPPTTPTRRDALTLAAGAAATLTTPAAAQTPSLDERIGRMLLFGFTGADANSASARALAADVEAGRVGGVLFLGYNVRSRAGVRALTRLFREAAGRRRVWISIDQEGGAVQRLGRRLGFEAFPTARVVAGTSQEQARALYSRMARVLAQEGFNLNLAPVVDLEVEPRNPIIFKYGRGFGREPERAALFASAFVEGHRDQRVATSLKHFPGHGSTLVDSHVTIVDMNATWRAEELVPYQRMIASGHADMVMTGHLSHRSFGAGPASLSRVAVTDVLRGRLGFQGVVLTDDLDMAAVRKLHALEEATVRAIAAGSDLVMVSNSVAPDPAMPRRLIAAVKAAVERGTISEAHVDAANRRLAAVGGRVA